MTDNRPSRDRVLAAANHRTADRVPLTFDAEKEVYEALHAHYGTESKEALFDRLGVDTWYVGPRTVPPADPPPDPDDGTTDSMWGFRTKRVEYEGGAYGELAYSPLAGKDELADIDNLPWPTPDVLDYSHADAACDTHRDRAIIGTFGWGAYFRATYVRGMENLMMDFALRPAYAERLIRTIADCTLAFLDKLLAACGPKLDIVYMADDYCSQLGPLFSPETFRNLILPYLREAAAKTHAYNKKFLLHCCGSVRPLMGMIIDAGVDILEPIQIRAEGMDPAGLKRDFGKDICFWGGVDLQRVLCQGTTRQVADEVRRLIDILGTGGGYVLGPGHTYIQPDAPLYNVITMYDTAREYVPW